jgi:tetratricopeptide (TPR) repeat protein
MMTIQEKLERATEYHKYNWLEEAEKYYRVILAENPENPEVNFNLGDLAMKVNKPEVALVFFEKALKLNPESLQFQQSLKLAQDKLNDIKFENQNIFELKGNDCIFERKIQSLENKLFLLNDKFNNLHESLNYLDIFEAKKKSDIISNMLPVEVINKNSSKTLLAFGGMSSGLSMPPKEFFQSLSSNDINIIFIKDFRQCWYQQGLLGKSEDIDSTISYLRSIIPKTTDTLITLGASAGGYAAIRFGIPLNANRIIAFSPQTLIDEETVIVFSKGCLNHLKFDDDNLDLKKIFERYQMKMEKINIEVYYGKYNNRDRKAIEHIYEYVKAFPFDTDSHLLASFLKEKGILKEILGSI